MKKQSGAIDIKFEGIFFADAKAIEAYALKLGVPAKLIVISEPVKKATTKAKKK